MTEFIQQFISRYGGVAGVCGAKPLDESYYKGFTPFVKTDMEARVNPAQILPGVASVIAACLPHRVPQPKAAGMELSSLGSFEDYHKRFKPILHQLAAELKTNFNINFRYKVLVDSATLDERAFAARAGICFFGLSGMAIVPGIGSFINIGLLLTDIPLENFKTVSNAPQNTRACPPGCKLCIEACPGSAIEDGKPLNVLRCASYLTQREGDLTEDEKQIIGRNLYGCDICRQVCPFNKKTPRVVTPEVLVEELISNISQTAMAWRGAEILQRNAEVVKRNLFSY